MEFIKNKYNIIDHVNTLQDHSSTSYFLDNSGKKENLSVYEPKSDKLKPFHCHLCHKKFQTRRDINRHNTKTTKNWK